MRELLINVAKHAGTGSRDVECRSTAGQVIVSVADEGVGYDAASLGAGSARGLGLINVRERLSLIGGTADFRSAHGQGTVAVLTAPLGSEPMTTRVLLVEDHRMVREALCEVLARVPDIEVVGEAGDAQRRAEPGGAAQA